MSFTLGMIGRNFGPVPTTPPTLSVTRRSLVEQMEDDLGDVFLDADNRDAGFSERVTYYPADDTARAFDVVIEEIAREETEDSGDEMQEERIRVFVQRDATAGITDPQIEDELARAGEDDHRYQFTGDIEEKAPDAWVLVFMRWNETGRGA